MQQFTAILFCVVALCACNGCASSDYHRTTYYRTTLQRLEAEDASQDSDSLRSRPARFAAGASRVEITPPIGTPLQGFGARRGEPSLGVQDPLYARVLFLQGRHGQIILIGCDLMGVTDNLCQAVFEKVKRKLPISRRDLIVFATHTHSGVGGLSNRFAMELVGGHFRRKLFADTTDKIAAAILEAAGHTQPAQIAFGSSEVADLNRNRAWPDAPVDREVKVMRVTNAENKPIAWLVNFSAHPTIFGANREFTADFPGYLAHELEQDGAVCLFANGAAGDLNIQKHDDASREARSQRVGKTLAGKVHEIAPTLHGTDAPLIETRRVEVEFPPVQIRLGQNPNCTLPSWLGGCFFPRKAPIELVRIDHELLLAAPVEFCAAVGLDLKQAASRFGYDLFIIGYANDYIGYVVPEKYYATKAYEARTSFYGPKLDGYLKEVIVKMMETMPKQNPRPE